MIAGEFQTINNRRFKRFITKKKIAETISRLALNITTDYRDKEIVYVITLKGSIFFASDLIRQIPLKSSLEVVSAKSYGSGMITSGDVQIINLLPEVSNKHVIIIEDIVDSGMTLHTLFDKINQGKPASLEAVTLLSKPSVRQVDVDVKFVGIEIPPEFVVGYGLDYDEQGRELPEIYVLDE